jgi:hypothetical protein
MKTNKRPATSKLVANFDNQLKEMLMEDLRAIKAFKNGFMKLIKTEQLSVA